MNDTIVEEDEFFYVQVEQVVSSDDLRFSLNPEFTLITIIDNNGGNLSFFTFIPLSHLSYIIISLSLSFSPAHIVGGLPFVPTELIMHYRHTLCNDDQVYFQ